MSSRDSWRIVSERVSAMQPMLEARRKQLAFDKEYARLAKITLENERFERAMKRIIKPTIKSHMKP